MTSPILLSHERLEELERLLEQRTAELLDARKDLEDFRYSVSHDLRAPLRHIIGFAEIIREDYGGNLDPECREHFSRLHAEANRMARLLSELLRLARLGPKEMYRQTVELDALVQAVVQDLARGTAERDVEWKIGPLPRIECDATMMKLAIFHLLSNALKFTRPRARAVIEAGTIEKDGVTAIFVRDNGVGFDMKYADRLFAIFQRLHAAQDFEGVGAGLASTQRIVRRHGGRIWAEAAAGQGATFYFTLDGLQTAER